MEQRSNRARLKGGLSALVVSLLASSSAMADPVGVDCNRLEGLPLADAQHCSAEFFRGLIDPQVNQVAELNAVQSVRRSSALRLEDVRDVGILRTAGVSLGSRVAAAIDTSVAGVTTGVRLSPAAFSTSVSPWLSGLGLTLASVETSRLRVGVGWSFAVGPGAATSLRELPGLTQAFTPAQRQELRNHLGSLVADVSAVCATLVYGVRENEVIGEGPVKRLHDARRACGYEQAKGDEAVVDVAQAALNFLAAWVTTVDAPTQLRSGSLLPDRVAAVRGNIDAITRFRGSTPYSSVTSADVEDAAWHYRNSRPRYRVGLLGDIDFLPTVAGFVPATEPACTENAPYDSSSLPAVLPTQWRIRLEGSYALGRAFVSTTLGFTSTRRASCEKPTDRELRRAPFRAVGDVTVAATYTLLTPQQFGANNRPSDVGPRLDLGVEINVGVGQPDSQVDGDGAVLRRVSVTPYLGVRVSSTVGFRLGVPVLIERAYQHADAMAMLPATDGYRVTFPVFGTTILTLP